VSSQPVPRDLNSDLLQALRGMKSAQRFQKGDTLFDQGSRAEGVYLVESGEVSMLLSTGRSQRQLVDVAGSGTILGLSESMSAENHRITAVAADETRVVFIPREEFLAFLQRHRDFCMQIVRLLSEDLHGLYHKFRAITAHPGRPRRRPLDEQLN
jgi:CRP/FNR family transcriptional regulator, polysaccharide utilization system transcription regulator